MNKKCQLCGGICCTGTILVYSVDKIYYDADLVRESEEHEPDRVMLTGEGGRCIDLKDGKCSIYPRRPTVCREFYCK